MTVSAALNIVTSLPDATLMDPYEETLTAAGGTAPFFWNVVAGILPEGLSIDGASGVISGTPTKPISSDFTIQVTDATGASATEEFTLTVGP
jgi:hypothetical protein